MDRLWGRPNVSGAKEFEIKGLLRERSALASVWAYRVPAGPATCERQKRGGGGGAQPLRQRV
jgi:hypothetical protein